MDKILKIVDGMKTDGILNYVVAGLDSYLLGNGKVRLFECSRNHQDQLTPHSHRFDFACIVLAGSVTNRVWTRCTHQDGDIFMTSTLSYNGEVGNHTVSEGTTGYWKYTDTVYTVGESYGMSSSEVHSIQFSKDAKVLFFEGETQRNTSIIIEPFVHGKTVSTYHKAPYMFEPADKKEEDTHLGPVDSRAIKVVASQLSLNMSSISLDSHKDRDLDTDSLEDVEIIMAIEEEFDIQIQDGEAEKLVYVRDLVALVEHKLAEN